MNKISSYRAERNLSRSDLAVEWGVTAEAIRLFEAGARQPSPHRALAIERITEGRVTRADLRPDIFGDEAGAPQQIVVGSK